MGDDTCGQWLEDTLDAPEESAKINAEVQDVAGFRCGDKDFPPIAIAPATADATAFVPGPTTLAPPPFPRASSYSYPHYSHYASHRMLRLARILHVSC